MVNLRLSRFTNDTLPYDESKEGCSLATNAGQLAPHVELKEDGEVDVQLHTTNRSGLWVDDLIGFSMKWLRSLPRDSYRTHAITALLVAMFVLDDRAVDRHGYSESAEERLTPPDKARLPSDEEWMAVLHSVRQATDV